MALSNSLGKQKPPPAPDYTGAAEATAKGNLEATKYATNANRITQVTPYGTLGYRYNPVYDAQGKETGQGWEQYINLTDEGRQLLDQQNKTSLGLAGLQDTATARVAETQANPFDYKNVQDVSDAAYKQQTARLDPEWSQRENQMRTRLSNQGIMQGSEAYDNAMREFNQGRNDAYGQARMNAYNMAPTQLQLVTALRNQNLNELNAIRTGSQVTNPTFNSFAQQQTTTGPDYLGATNQLYTNQLNNVNATNAARAATVGGLMKLGASFMGGA